MANKPWQSNYVIRRLCRLHLELHVHPRGAHYGPLAVILSRLQHRTSSAVPVNSLLAERSYQTRHSTARWCSAASRLLPAMGGFESVGTLLADIANLISEGLRIFSLADKRHWGQDEHEQHRALEEVLNEAKRDFQELTPLVSGQYEHDRKRTSVLSLSFIREAGPFALNIPYSCANMI